jgi:hypothetical protein
VRRAFRLRNGVIGNWHPGDYRRVPSPEGAEFYSGSFLLVSGGGTPTFISEMCDVVRKFDLPFHLSIRRGPSLSEAPP